MPGFLPSSVPFPERRVLDGSVHAKGSDYFFIILCLFVSLIASIPYPFFAIKEKDSSYNRFEFFLSAVFNITLYYYFNERRFREFPEWIRALSKESYGSTAASVTQEVFLLGVTIVAGAGARASVKDLPLLHTPADALGWAVQVAQGVMNVPGMRNLLGHHVWPLLQSIMANIALLAPKGQSRSKILWNQVLDLIQAEVLLRIAANIAGPDAPASPVGQQIAQDAEVNYFSPVSVIYLPKSSKNKTVQEALVWGVWSVFATLFCSSNAGLLKTTLTKVPFYQAIISIGVILAFGLKLLSSGAAQALVYGHKHLETRSGKIKALLVFLLCVAAYPTAVGSKTMAKENFQGSVYLPALLWAAVLGTIFSNASGAVRLLLESKRIALLTGKLDQDAGSSRSLFNYGQGVEKAYGALSNMSREEFLQCLHLAKVDLACLIDRFGFEAEPAIRVLSMVNGTTEAEVVKTFYPSVGRARVNALLNVFLASCYICLSEPRLVPSLSLLSRLVCVGALGFVAPIASLAVSVVASCRGQNLEKKGLLSNESSLVSKNSWSFWGLGKTVFRAALPAATGYLVATLAESLSMPAEVIPWLAGGMTMSVGVYEPLSPRL